MSKTWYEHRLMLNCDMGESLGAWRMGMDEQIMPLVDMANVACGFHASDPVTMKRTVAMAKQHGVRVGAHPSYPDLVGFGRRSMQCSMEEITTLIQYQLGALAGICRANGVNMSYVKPHGALYNDMMKSSDIFQAVLQGVADFDNQLPLMVLASNNNDFTQALARQFAVPLIFEAFADRAYSDDGSLVPRGQLGAVLDNEQAILSQALRLAKEGSVMTPAGKLIQLQANSLCVHGDNPASVAAVKTVRAALDDFYLSPSL